ncbi:MAG TPA: hypothetical protein VFN29_10535 [Chiayiivirga sp.]|nr:hypothetical protein [Chiayiivirga sp.]
MQRTRIALIVLALAALSHTTAKAELVIGSGSASDPIRFFSANAQGSDAPVATIEGAATQLGSATFGVYEPREQLIYVSDFWGQALRVYPAFTYGNVAPIRVLNPPNLGQTRASAPIVAHDEIAVIASNCCIYTYPLHANGNAVPPLRAIGWGGSTGSATELDNPISLLYLRDTDEYVVSEWGRIIFHARLAGHYDAPTRRITGPGVANSAGIAHDPEQHLLFVLRQDPWDAGTQSSRVRIAVFPDTASGDATPLYTIEGPATQLDLPIGNYVYGIGHDPWLHRIMVSSSSNSVPVNNRVLTFADTASGNAAPVQVLLGSNLDGDYLGTPFAAPAERPAEIFVDGFEP